MVRKIAMSERKDTSSKTSDENVFSVMRRIGQAKAVVFFLFVVVFSLLQLHFTRSKEVQA